MAKKKEDKKKKKDRKPSAITGSGMKAVTELAEQALKAGKRLKYKGKLTKTGKDKLVAKTLTDPADKAAIAKARTIKGKKEVLNSKASQNAIIRNTKNVGKRASKESQKAYNERAMKAQASQDAQKMKDRNQITKSRIKSERAKRVEKKASTPPAVPKGANERRLPTTDLKPKSKTNAKAQVKPNPQTGEPQKIKGKTTVGKSQRKKLTKGEKVAVGAAAGGAALIAKNKLTGNKKSEKKTEKANAVAPVTNKTQKGKPATAPSKKSKIAPRPEVKKTAPNEAPKKAPSLTKTVESVTSSDKVKKKFPKGVPPKLKSEAIAKAREYKKKNKDVPWEKIIESLTMIISSYILSRGISKRYK